MIDEVPVVKLNYKWGLFSIILLQDAAFCKKIAIFMKLFHQKENWTKKNHFGQKATLWRKIKEKRPHLKFNFTTRISSIYLSRPFLKLGNDINLILVQHLHISTFYTMLTSKSSLSYVLCCNLVNFSRSRMESKVSFGIKISWAIQWL